MGIGVGGKVSPGPRGASVTGAMVGVLVASIYPCECVCRVYHVPREEQVFSDQTKPKRRKERKDGGENERAAMEGKAGGAVSMGGSGVGGEG